MENCKKKCLNVAQKGKKCSNSAQKPRKYCRVLEIVSRVCENFLVCQARVSAVVLFIGKDWLRWVKKETWSHSGSCLVCK